MISLKTPWLGFSTISVLVSIIYMYFIMCHQNWGGCWELSLNRRWSIATHTYLAGETPWSRRRFTFGEAQPLHSGCADPDEFPKCGNLNCIISGSGGLRSRSPLICCSLKCSHGLPHGWPKVFHLFRVSTSNGWNLWLLLILLPMWNQTWQDRNGFTIHSVDSVCYNTLLITHFLLHNGLLV